jgi:MarR family transcriptional regulator, organic hydroperoxide resistance regulator
MRVARRKPVAVEARKSQAFLDDYLPYLLGRASYVINKDFDKHVQSYGLSPLEWRVLATLSDRDGRTIGDLAQMVVAQQPTLTKAIKRMAQVELVRTADGEDDQRKTIVYETDKGRALAATLIKQAREHEASLLAAFTASDVSRLREILRVLIERGHAPLGFLRP